MHLQFAVIESFRLLFLDSMKTMKVLWIVVRRGKVDVKSSYIVSKAFVYGYKDHAYLHLISVCL